MQRSGSPEYAAHKAEHDKLVGTCADLHQKFRAGTASVTVETTALFRDCL
ncbi:MAG: hypothetical protein RL385_1794 [Pseudomonadota bacterium]|jgi:hemerythrin